MQVWYMNGAGNDFMVIDARGKEADFAKMARRLCAMTHADGFMAVGDSDTADFKLHFYNPDGSRGEMCGNGARCICRFAYEHGIAGQTMTVETDAGPVYGWRLAEDRFRVKLNNPGILDLDRKPGVAYVELGMPGIPHGVLEWPELDWSRAEELREQAKALRYDPAFPKGANISFYTWTGTDTVRVLTYERGVEDYTLACGTGCGSIAAVLWKQGKLPGGKLVCQNRGGDLQITLDGQADTITALLLEGPVTVLGSFDIDTDREEYDYDPT